MLKDAGYTLSTISVLLLAVVSWKTAATHDLAVTVCLIVGIALSIAGMVMRWIHHNMKHAAQRRCDPPPRW